MNGATMNQVYDLMKPLTINQLLRLRDVEGAQMIKLGREAYVLFLHQCNFAIEKKRQGKW